MQRRIEWSDTDASGHWHNTAAFRLAETAETLLFSRLGILRDVYGRVPRVHIEADFLRVLRFPDTVEVDLAIQEVGESSITYDWRISRDGEACVRGRIVAVLVGEAGGEKASWSDEHRDVLLTSGPQRPELLTSSRAE